MQLTVKSVKVGATGTSKRGDWELIVVTSQDDTDYTTFHKNAKDIPPGSVIEVEDTVVKDGKTSFKEFVIVSKPAPVADVGVVAEQGQLTGQGNIYAEKNGMTPEDWKEKQSLERISIEGQTCIKQLVLALSTDIFDEEDALKLTTLLKTALTTKIITFIGGMREPEVGIKGVETSKPKSTITPSKGGGKLTLEELKALVFKDPGEFYLACHKHFNLDKSRAATEIGDFDLFKAAGRLGAWAAILAVYGNEEDPDKLFKK